MLAKLAFNHEWKRIGDLVSACEDATDECWTGYLNCIHRSKTGLFKAFLDEGWNIKLEIEPDSFEDHGYGNTRMQV